MKFFEKPYRVLVIDDDEGDFFLIKDYLQDYGPENYIVEWVPNYDDGVKALKESNHHIYLIDQLLGAGTGVELITSSTEAGNNLPKILLTGIGNRQLDIKAIEAGAADYLPKEQLNTEMLERTIRHALERYEQRAISEEQNMRFKALFEGSIDPIYITNEHWEIEDVNQSFLKLFDLKPENIKGMHIGRIFKNPTEFLSFAQKTSGFGYAQNFSTDLIKSNGDLVTALVSASTMVNLEKKVIGFQGLIHDITQLKKAEYELMLADQYNLTNRMARMIAHEVRNPLTNITLAITQMEDGDAEENELYLDMIGRNSTRINNLINDLLNSTKIAKPEFTDTYIEDVLVMALDHCRDRIKLKEVQLNIEGLNKQTLIKADAEKLSMAFTNILTNAIEATEEVEQPIINIDCIKGKKTFKVIITDNGKGMDDETRDNLFKAFFSKRRGGMGLGMTTVQNIVYQHKGDILVDSMPGEGTTFSIILPISQNS